MTARIAGYRMTVTERGEPLELFRRLGMQADAPTAGVVVLRCGAEKLTLEEGDHDARRIASTSDLGFQHIAIVVRDVDRVLAGLPAALVERVSRRPETLAMGVRAVYLRAREGHYLELISFPKGVGDPRWQEGPLDRAIGIDHSAIVVASTAPSLAFWRDEIGLAVVATGLNEGDEQASLTAVDGAAVRITSLRGARGPGVELLEWLRPVRTGAHDSPTGAWTIVVGGAGARGRRLDPDGHAVDTAEDNP